MRHLLISTALLLPLPALADDVALILGAERYERQDRVRGADNILRAEDRLQALGFDVFSRANPRADAARDLAVEFQAGVDGAERLIVALSGHFVTDGNRTWLLTAEADAPDLFTVQDMGLSVDSVLAILAERPARSVLVLGAGARQALDLDDSALRSGVGALDIPQGVTVIRTGPSTAADLMNGLLTEPEAVIGAALLNNSDVTVSGYIPRDLQLMPAEVEAEEQDDPSGTLRELLGLTQDDLNAEAELWDQTTAANDVEAYRLYIRRFPEGRFVQEAEAQIREILAEPNRNARLAEEALNLNRAARREIQADLTLLDYNTRGVDGIFGRGTRGAITNWQQSNGFPQTSYLTRDQINLLEAQAARRRAEIEAEEARERARAEARDRAYWSETGALGDEPGYRAYLDRFPEGLFADIARSRLGEIEERRAQAAQQADQRAWTDAQVSDTVAAYRDYLAAFPNGSFAAQARDRIEALEGPNVTQAQIAQARSEEQGLRLSGVRAQLLELRLRDLGHNPGRLDGVIDDATRRAIASYQEEQGVTPTGYVDRATAVGLMTGGIQFNLNLQ